MIKAFVSGVCCVALLLLGGRVCAQERATRLTLDEAVGLALRENPTLRAKGYELEATRAAPRREVRNLRARAPPPPGATVSVPARRHRRPPGPERRESRAPRGRRPQSSGRGLRARGRASLPRLRLHPNRPLPPDACE